MQLTLRDIARLMQVPERTVHRWVQDESLPARLVGGQYRFNPSELFEWASQQRLAVPEELLVEQGQAHCDSESLAGALTAGGVLFDVPGGDRRAALSAVVERLRLPDGFDRRRLLDLFLHREAQGSTAVGDGIAIPHPRYPVVLSVPSTSATLCFLSHPIDFAAADGKPVDTLFVLVSPTVRSHLKVLSQLAAALRGEEFRQLVRRKATADEIVGAAVRCQNAAANGNGGSHGRKSRSA
ncbi:MAG TPA: PTS sugar transporter subunit IIA [Pirellulales bacterium]|nr:PTS sugar transporter subunit IIA [Pirellulales bacterium]